MRLRWKILIVVLVVAIVLAIGTSLHYMMLNTSRLNTVDNQNNTEIAQQVEADEEVEPVGGMLLFILSTLSDALLLILLKI